MKKTLKYYEDHAQHYSETTKSVDLSSIQEVFLSYIQEKGTILDFGCGSGRDAKAFVERGYQVEAIDGSSQLCEIATAFTGIPVQHLDFRDLKVENRYDGVWACASILHLAKKELRVVIQRIIKSLKKQGVLYASFKYGTFEGERNHRHFTDFTEASFAEFLSSIDGLSVEKEWITKDVRVGKETEQWLNIILKKG